MQKWGVGGTLWLGEPTRGSLNLTFALRSERVLRTCSVP